MKSVITKDIAYCQNLLRDKKLVAIPTETVYGLAATIFDDEAINNIFKIKERPLFNPLIVHIHNPEQLDILTTHIPKAAKKLMDTFWPGPLTLVLSKSSIVSDLVTAGKSTVAIRMPAHPITRQLLKGLDFPLAAPSANPFTRISPTSAQHVATYFGNRIPAILDGGICTVGLESTIVGFNGDSPIIYRKGGISKDRIEACVGSVEMLVTDNKAPIAPGMLLKHYSPKTPLILEDDVVKAIKENASLKIGVLLFKPLQITKVQEIRVLSENGNLEEAAQKLFYTLHELDALNLDLIIAQRFPENGLGNSINDRLERAANS